MSWRWLPLAGATIACSETGLSGRLDQGIVGGPRIVVDPSEVAFGGLPRGVAATRSVRFANAGTSTLHIDRWLLGPSTTFSVPDLARVDLEPGEAVLREVAYTATNPMDVSWLTVVSDDPDRPEVKVPLSGTALLPELTIDPDPEDFGPVWCSESAVVGLRNTGDATLTIEGVLVEGAAYAVESEPSLPVRLLAGEALPLSVTFGPGGVGGEHFGALVVDSDDPRGVRRGTLIGSGIAPLSHRDEFDQVSNDWTRADLMFFVDQSGSMDDDALNLGENFNTLVQILDARGLDYHLMVVNDDDGCHDAPILTPTTIGGAEIFLDATQAGGGAYTEAGLIVTRNAELQFGQGECNAGFQRYQVTTIAVLLSDEPEQSPGGYAQYLAEIQADQPEMVITTVVGQPGSACAANGVGYHESAAATGGADLEICDTDWAENFYDILGVIDEPLSSFALSATPDPATIAVSIDGQPGFAWSYDAASNAVVFPDVSLPPPGTHLVVTYDERVVCP